MALSTYKLGKVCTDIYSGGTPSTINPEYWNGNLKWLSSGETSADFISDTVQHITEKGVENSSTRLARKGSVVMACAGQGKTRGQVSYLLSDMYVNQSVIVMATNSEVLNSLYLFYNLKNRYNELRGNSDASSIRGSITTTALKTLTIELPDIKQQKAIANILRVYDDLIEKNNRKIAILQEMAEELYKEWFVRFRFPGYQTAQFKDGIPEEWQIKRMSDFCYVTDGTHDTPSPQNKGVPLVTGKCIHNGFIDFSQAYLISTKDHENIKVRSGLESGDILFSNIGTVGITCYVDYLREFSVKNVIIFKPQNEIQGNYLYYWLNSKAIQECFSNQTNGASQQFVGLTFMRRFKILVPKIDVLEKFYNSIGNITKAKIKIHNINENLKTQRDLLLPRLMSGKLEVKA